MSTRKYYTSSEIASWTDVPSEGFILTVHEQQHTVEAVLRFLPGKRLVAKAVIDGKTVLAKYFLGSSAVQQLKLELAGLVGFVNAGIDSPKVIGSLQSYGFSFVLTEFFSQSESLASLWRSELSDKERYGLLEVVVQIIAKLHKEQIIHDDPHLDNFLVFQKKLFLIDGGGVEVKKAPITPKKAFENLALFFSILFPGFDHLSLACYSVYQRLNPLPDYSEQQLAAAIQRKRKWRERYLEKIFRTCTDFVAESSFQHFQVVDRRESNEALSEFLSDPELYIKSGQFFKRGSTNTVAIVTLKNGRKVFVKRYQSKKGVLHKYLRSLRQSRARRAWYAAHYLLRLLGVDTPKPLALLEHKLGCLVIRSYLVTEYIEAEDALSYFTQRPITAEVKEKAEKLLDIIASLKSGMVFHGDMKATNFILTRERMMAIDLDQTRICKTRRGFNRLHRKDIERFQRNWAGTPAAELFSAIH